MKVLIVAQHVNLFRNLDHVLRELCARGHEVLFLHGTRLDDQRTRQKLQRKRTKMVFMGRGLEVAQSQITGVTSGYRPEPTETWQKALMIGRSVLSRASYHRRNHPSPERTVEAFERDLPPWIQRRVNSWLWRTVLARPLGLRLWRWIEAAVSPSETLCALLKDVAPDVMLVAPTVWPKNPLEADYITAGQKLGLPVIGYVNSWDNLTSKGTVHVVPDAFLVWNEAMAREAEEIHDVPRSVIRITGTAHLDGIFTLAPNETLGALSARMGAPDDRPYVLYLCSSRTLIASETAIVTALADAIRRRLPDRTPTVVVRPHPTNPAPWETFEHPGVIVYPRHGDQADCPDAWQEYFNQLALASCCFGLNTTAFLEAVVADRPCLTMVSDDLYPVQGRTGHFRHLLAGDFLEIAPDVAGVAERVARVLEGADEKKAGRRGFTKWFLRPCGIERPVAPIVCDIIETMARPASATGRHPYRGEPVPGLVLSADGTL